MTPTVWSRTTKRLVVVGLVIILLLLLYVFRDLLPPVAIALVLAYLLKPLADQVERRTKLPRALAVILVFLALLLVISLILIWGVPFAVVRIGRLNLDIQQLGDDLIAFLSQPVIILGYSVSLQDLVGDLQGALQDLLQPFATQTIGLLFNVASSLLWVISILIISFYLVKDADRLRSFLDLEGEAIRELEGCSLHSCESPEGFGPVPGSPTGAESALVVFLFPCSPTGAGTRERETL